MFLSFRHLLGWIISAFYSRQDLILENLALREQLLALHAKRPRHRLSASQKMFWVLLQRLCGQDGKLCLSWSHHKPWCSGIAAVFASTGSGSPEPGRSVDASPSAKSFGRASSAWVRKTQPGEHRGFMVNYLNSASMYPNPPSRVGCGGHPEALILASAGLAFFATTARQLRPWTSLPFRRSPSASCIVSSSSVNPVIPYSAETGLATNQSANRAIRLDSAAGSDPRRIS